MGELLPVGLTEVLPGDSFDHSASALVRLAPMASPIMHPVQLRIHHFFVPNRLVWDGWEDFITAPVEDQAESVPLLTASATAGSLTDLYGLPLVARQVNALPIYGYNAIWNEYYRDQDITSEVALTNLTPQLVAWEKDYATTARPWPQKGTALTVPVTAGVPDTVSIRNLRWGNALQRVAERRARYGSRYAEYLKSEFGVSPEDARLDRPEYLGGGKVQVNISEILQTAPETLTPGSEYGVGDMYGHGIGAVRTNRYKFTAPEHGYIHSLLSVRPKAIYAQGCDRHWLKTYREHYFLRDFQHLGQQEVWNGEVYLSGTDDKLAWGYQDRYREYKENRSKVTGDFRTTFDHWHLGRIFTSRPSLASGFIQCAPSDRIFNIQNEETLLIAVNHRMNARRTVRRGGEAYLV